MNMFMNTSQAKTQPAVSTHWLKRMGLAGFAFFFLKGLLWLLIPWLAHSAMF